MKILLDTNFLINCSKFHIDYQEQLKGHELYVLDRSIKELENLINQKKAKNAKLALQILKAKNIKTLKTSSKKDVDTLLREKKAYAVATNDKELISKIKNKKIFIIRQKKLIKEL